MIKKLNREKNNANNEIIKQKNTIEKLNIEINDANNKILDQQKLINTLKYLLSGNI